MHTHTHTERIYTHSHAHTRAATQSQPSDKRGRWPETEAGCQRVEWSTNCACCAVITRFKHFASRCPKTVTHTQRKRHIHTHTHTYFYGNSKSFWPGQKATTREGKKKEKQRVGIFILLAKGMCVCGKGGGREEGGVANWLGFLKIACQTA